MFIFRAYFESCPICELNFGRQKELYIYKLDLIQNCALETNFC